MRWRWFGWFWASMGWGVMGGGLALGIWIIFGVGGLLISHVLLDLPFPVPDPCNPRILPLSIFMGLAFLVGFYANAIHYKED